MSNANIIDTGSNIVVYKDSKSGLWFINNKKTHERLAVETNKADALKAAKFFK